MDAELTKYIVEHLQWKRPLNTWRDLLAATHYYTAVEDPNAKALSTAEGVEMQWSSEDNTKIDVIRVIEENGMIVMEVNGIRDQGMTEDEVTQVLYNVLISFITNRQKGIV